jgi:hypothetical protein
MHLDPLDLAYDHARRLRRSWRGLDGGDARREIAGFFGARAAPRGR